MVKRVLVCVAFLALAALHVGFPVSMLAERAAILEHGTEIRLALTTQDPRSLFRGEYSQLAYTIGNLRDLPLSENELDQCGPAAPGSGQRRDPSRECEIISGADLFVLLQPDENGVQQPVAVSVVQPRSGMFIRGKARFVAQRATLDANCPAKRCFTGQVTYGIESWFGPQGVPAQIDRAARSSVVAIVRVDKSGKAVLANLLLDGKAVGPS